MGRLFQKITAKAVLLTNILVVFLFLFSCYASRLDPVNWWFTGFLTLLMPYLLVGVMLFAFLWLFFRPRWSLLSVAAVIFAMPAVATLLPFNRPADFRPAKPAGTIRVMTWNIRYFVPFRKTYYEDEDGRHRQAILDEVRNYNPDVVCFQEFTTDSTGQGFDNIRYMRDVLGYRHHFFAADLVHWKKVVSGMAVFSKYPIVRRQLHRYPEFFSRQTENTVSADIPVGNDTVRIFSMHLESFGFQPRDYNSFGKIRKQQDTGLVASKNLIRKMGNAFTLHGMQADFTSNLVDQSPYPAIVCGDLNDVPNSYAYITIKGKRKDAFLEKGFGLGSTFTSPTSRVLSMLTTLRIDYIFTDPRFTVLQTTRGKERLSDHRAIVADLQMPEKE